MALEIKLNQKLSQSLVMTPQLQQAIKLLQLGRQEYLEVLEKELLENPVLEDASDEHEGGSESRETAAESANNAAVLKRENELNGDVETFRFENESTPNITRDGETPPEERFSLTDFGVSKSAVHYEGDDRSSIESTVSNPEGLSGHLLWQLRTSDLPKEDHDIAVQIIGNLDQNGFLRTSVQELANACNRSAADVEEVLSFLQSFDPPGIAARDLGECLMIQLEQQGYSEHLASRIVSQHLSKLEIRQYEAIAKAENITLEEVYEAIKLIQTLEPRPGRPFIDETPVYITPDIYVRRVNNDFVISLNDIGMPRLRLSSHYQELLSAGTNGKSKKEREYLQECIRSASWLIKSIHQRQQTIYKVTESIVKYQRDFFEQGVSVLKPLVLRDVAEDVGMHESTVSRVTTNKYVHTPQGVYELKFFFSSGIQSGAGEVSSESVKERLRQLVDAEDPKKPISDQAIVNALKAEGVTIARRTVAKYREMLNILSSSRRKRMF